MHSVCACVCLGVVCVSKHQRKQPLLEGSSCYSASDGRKRPHHRTQTHRGRAVDGFASVFHAPSWAPGLHLRMNTNEEVIPRAALDLEPFSACPFLPQPIPFFALPDISALAHIPKLMHLTVGVNVFQPVMNLQNVGRRSWRTNKMEGGHRTVDQG